MAERHPIYSAHAVGQQIGYIEDDQAFDRFDRACAVYESNTGLLRDPKHKAVVGYVSLTDVFVGSSWMAQQLFFKAEPVTSQLSPEEPGDDDSNATVCEAGDKNAEKAGVAFAPAPPPDHAAKSELFVAPTPVESENASVENHTSGATDIMTFESSSRQDKAIDTALAPTTSPLLRNSSTEQPAQSQNASDAGKVFAGEPGSDHRSSAMGETASALQPDADDGATLLASSDENTLESAQPDQPSGGDGMPPAVDAFMRHLTEYLHSSNHQTATPSSDDAAEVKLTPSVEAQRDVDQVPFPPEPGPEGESSGSAPHSGLTSVDREHTEDCSSARMDSPVEMPRANHQEGNSGATAGEETNDASRDIFPTEMDQVLRAVWREVQKNSSGA
jgi:hypothetical protein